MMKTLDEVIEIASDWTNGFDEMSIEKQMLHYLKEYRNKEMFYNQSVDHMVLMMNEHEDRVAMYLAEMHKNNPLTWSELKQMEGKPVWVEINGYNGYWTIVHWNSNIVFEEYYDWIASPEDPMKAPLVSLDDTNFGKTWQAYRKERK